MDGPAFVAYIRDVLVPEIQPGTVVILDNLATHKNKEAEAVLHAPWLLVLVPAALQPRPEPNRNGFLQTESPPASHRSAILLRTVQCAQRKL